ncbi:ubiquitin-domain-containing protein [Mytilinidion resinicola]|uniref:Ubiquitin-domain-containing protein n=1 Tax=Mytilinidion resinicola TaxID=574789 RepID=A0A6A6YA70_9PEZI|nr:ubiquitin-domain-containing protein [Mytilinidion resinicola]KAF2805015.1 ubiquitin-domain-containing protein [Mytilinidion resinicola]
MDCEIKNDAVVLNEDLEISFRRTIRVLDNKQTSNLPPDLGAFPLYPVSKYAKTLPADMTSKGGVFLPMYHKSKHAAQIATPFAIKIYVGGINAISGEPALENMATKLRRATMMSNKQGRHLLQDYIVATQLKLRQFEVTPSKEAMKYLQRKHWQGLITVRTPHGESLTFDVASSDTMLSLKKLIKSGKSIATEDQRLTYGGKSLDDAKCFEDYRIEKGNSIALSFVGKTKEAFHQAQQDEWKAAREARELAHALRRAALLKKRDREEMESSGSWSGTVVVKTKAGKQIQLEFDYADTIDDIKTRIEYKEGIPPDQQRLVFKGRQMDDGKTMSDYGVATGDTIHIFLRLRGGGGDPLAEQADSAQMGLAAGGQIKQVIKRDDYDPSKWIPALTTVFNIQILNTNTFRSVTGVSAPPTPITMETYVKHGLPFFSLDESPSSVAREFNPVKSVAEIDEKETDLHPQTLVNILPSATITEVEIGLTNPNGPMITFRTRKDLEADGYNVVKF